MNLKDALLCINCDEVFTAVGSACNPRCPSCASSVFAPLSAWVQTWAALENSQVEAKRVMRDGASTGRPRMEIIRSDAYRCLTLGSRVRGGWDLSRPVLLPCQLCTLSRGEVSVRFGPQLILLDPCLLRLESSGLRQDRFPNRFHRIFIPPSCAGNNRGLSYTEGNRGEEAPFTIGALINGIKQGRKDMERLYMIWGILLLVFVALYVYMSIKENGVTRPQDSATDPMVHRLPRAGRRSTRHLR